MQVIACDICSQFISPMIKVNVDDRSSHDITRNRIELDLCASCLSCLLSLLAVDHAKAAVTFGDILRTARKHQPS